MASNYELSQSGTALLLATLPDIHNRLNAQLDKVYERLSEEDQAAAVGFLRRISDEFGRNLAPLEQHMYELLGGAAAAAPKPSEPAEVSQPPMPPETTAHAPQGRVVGQVWPDQPGDADNDSEGGYDDEWGGTGQFDPTAYSEQDEVDQIAAVVHATVTGDIDTATALDVIDTGDRHPGEAGVFDTAPELRRQIEERNRRAADHDEAVTDRVARWARGDYDHTEFRSD